MRKRVLRALFCIGYVCLLTLLLLYQAGLFGERRDWTVAVLGTLFLGVALALVLALYLRVNDQIKEQRQQSDPQTAYGTDGGENGDREGKAAAGELGEVQKNTVRQNVSVQSGNYEEVYAHFLSVMEGRELSERELEVAWLLFRGYTNRQIGEELFIAETTVKKHVSHIYQKMGVCSRKEFRGEVQAGALSGSLPAE